MSFCFKNYILLLICVGGDALLRLFTQVPFMVANSASIIYNFFLFLLSVAIIQLFYRQMNYLFMVLKSHMLCFSFIYCFLLLEVSFNLYPFFTFDEVFTSLKRRVYSLVHSLAVVLYISTNLIPLNYIPSLFLRCILNYSLTHPHKASAKDIQRCSEWSWRGAALSDSTHLPMASLLGFPHYWHIRSPESRGWWVALLSLANVQNLWLII